MYFPYIKVFFCVIYTCISQIKKQGWINNNVMEAYYICMKQNTPWDKKVAKMSVHCTIQCFPRCVLGSKLNIYAWNNY